MSLGRWSDVGRLSGYDGAVPAGGRSGAAGTIEVDDVGGDGGAHDRVRRRFSCTV